MRDSIEFQYDDGGFREWYGKTPPENYGDCGVRALAIAGGLEYEEAVILLRCAHRDWRPRSRRRASVNWRRVFHKQDPRDGVYQFAMETALSRIGFVEGNLAIHRIGLGDFQPDYRMSSLPFGKLVVHIPGHYLAMINKTVKDTWDSRNTKRGTSRKCLRYWAARISTIAPI